MRVASRPEKSEAEDAAPKPGSPSKAGGAVSVSVSWGTREKYAMKAVSPPECHQRRLLARGSNVS